jgi:hypothetical protein
MGRFNGETTTDETRMPGVNEAAMRRLWIEYFGNPRGFDQCRGNYASLTEDSRTNLQVLEEVIREIAQDGAKEVPPWRVKNAYFRKQGINESRRPDCQSCDGLGWLWVVELWAKVRTVAGKEEQRHFVLGATHKPMPAVGRPYITLGRCRCNTSYRGRDCAEWGFRDRNAAWQMMLECSALGGEKSMPAIMPMVRLPVDLADGIDESSEDWRQ